MKSLNPVLVYGGTGYYGKHIVRHLLEKGEYVRVLSRNLGSAIKNLGSNPHIVEGDVMNPSTISSSLNNAGSVIIALSASHPGLIRNVNKIERDAVFHILDEMKDRGIERLVYLSVYDIRESLLKDLNIQDFVQAKMEVEQRIKNSGLNWTILGAAPSYELFFRLLRNNKLVIPGGGRKKIPSVSAEDVGEICAQAVKRDDLAGQRIRLTGPEAVSFPEMARMISEITGKKVRHLAIPLDFVNLASFLIKPVYPYMRYIYKSLKLLNNFPEDISKEVSWDHIQLRKLFDYKSVTLEEEIQRRLTSVSLI